MEREINSMEKQILQVLELHKSVNGEEIKKNPELIESAIKAKLMSDILAPVDKIRTADNEHQFAIGLTESIYTLLDMAIHAGIADRLPELFDAVHTAKMKTAHSSEEKVFDPYIHPIMEKDFHKYDEFKEVILQINENDIKILEAHVLKNISQRLKKHHLERWNSYLKDEKVLDAIVQVKYLGGGIEDRYAVVTVYGEEQEVKVDWAKSVKRKKKKNNE